MASHRTKTQNITIEQSTSVTKELPNKPDALGSKVIEKEIENISQEKEVEIEPFERAAERCPYCESNDFVKRGVRKNKHQEVQLYACRNLACNRTFTSRTIKGKQFPWPVVLDALSYHNLGYTFEQCSKILDVKTGMRPQPETIASWYEEYKPLCRFE